MFITPPDLPEDQVCRSIKIPNSLYWLGIFNKALIATIYPYNYKQVEDTHLTAEESAAIGYAIISEYLDGATCDPDDRPFWDDSDAADAPNNPDLDDGFPWYENVSDWIVTGFLALSFGPEAAIEFVTLARRFRLMFRTRDYGGIVRVLIDGVFQADVNTYSATPGIAYLDVFTPGATDDHDPDVPTWTLRIENTGDADPAAVPTEDGYALQVIRKRLYSAEVSPENLRYNEDCDCIQQTVDDGDTWTDVGGADPRHAPQYRFPPMGGDNQPCQSAANAAQWLEEFIEEALTILSEGGTIVSMVTLFVALFLVLGPWAILVTVLFPIAELIFSAGVTAVSAAFTVEAFNTLECLLYCNMSGNGQVDDAQLAAINEGIDAEIGGLAATILHLIFQAAGPVGLSNMGTFGEAPADCDDCEGDPSNTWSKTWSFLTSPNGWLGRADAGLQANWAMGGFTNSVNSGFDYFRQAFYKTFYIKCGGIVTGISLTFSGVQNYGRQVWVADLDLSDWQGINDFSNTPSTSPLGATVSYTTDGNALVTFLLDSSYASSFTVTSFTVNGTGTEPRWD